MAMALPNERLVRDVAEDHPSWYVAIVVEVLSHPSVAARLELADEAEYVIGMVSAIMVHGRKDQEPSESNG